MAYPIMIIAFSCISVLWALGALLKGNSGKFWSILAISLAGVCWYHALVALQVFEDISAYCWSTVEISPAGINWQRPQEVLQRMLPTTPVSAALDPATLGILALSLLAALMGWKDQNNSLRREGALFAVLPAFLVVLWLISLTYPGIFAWVFFLGALLAMAFFLSKMPAQGWNIATICLAGIIWRQTGTAEPHFGSPSDMRVDPAILSLFGLCLILTFFDWKNHERFGRLAQAVSASLPFFTGVVLPIIIWMHNAPPTLMF